MKKQYILIVIILCVLVIFYQIMDSRYRNKYRNQAEHVHERLLKEKEWIRQNQDESGAIYMNNPGAAYSTGDVNPYFACLSAQGLLAGSPDMEDMKAVQRYLLWHRREFLKNQGELSNYRLEKSQLVETGERDSVDSYVAVYLSLLCQYGLAGGDLNIADSKQAALQTGLAKLESLRQGGLTQVDEENETIYLMDNIEVLAAYEDIQELVYSNSGRAWLRTQGPQIKRRMSENIRDGKADILNMLWNKKEKRFEVGLGATDILAFSGWGNLYPDAVAQIYPKAFGVTLYKLGQPKLYRTFCENLKWEKMEFESEEFYWSILSYIAVLSGDVKRAETYLAEYEKKVDISRDYPLHTADAAWAAKAYAELEQVYIKRVKKGLL